MAVFNLGSINIDHVYSVPHLPEPGETLAATGYGIGLGGKGANQSVAAARAGARVFHIGAIGPGSDWVLDALRAYGVDTTHIRLITTPTGHAIINVDPAAENAIVLYSGANQQIADAQISHSLASAHPGDTLMLQNETSGAPSAARLAADMGLRVVYSAAPFDLAALRQVIAFAHLLLMNEGEALALKTALGDLPSCDMVITQGARGATFISAASEPLFVPAFPAQAVDTTGAGDCFAGFLIAGLDLGLLMASAMHRAAAAAALQVARPGAAQAMPDAAEVDALIAARSVPPQSDSK